jgi:hypothetical protein
VPTGPPTSLRAPPPDFLNVAPGTICSARLRHAAVVLTTAVIVWGWLAGHRLRKKVRDRGEVG